MKPKNFFIKGESTWDYECEVRHYEISDFTLYGGVYPVQEYEEATLYQSATSSSYEEGFDKERVRCLFDFSCTWRGCWDNRFYPKDNEYFGEEVQMMADIWAALEPQLKELVRQHRISIGGYDPFDIEK